MWESKASRTSLVNGSGGGIEVSERTSSPVKGRPLGLHFLFFLLKEDFLFCSRLFVMPPACLPVIHWRIKSKNLK